jgi:integrase
VGGDQGLFRTKAWYSALTRAGIENSRRRDLRHTRARWHVQGGTPLFALQELAGWETEKMVRRYAHLAAGHLAVCAKNMERPVRGGVPTFTRCRI